MTSTDIYTKNAHYYHERYQSLEFNNVHANWLHLLPKQPGFALDVGAGSGRDAIALSRRGWEVLAVEPSEGLRKLGEQAPCGQSVQWLDDRMPELERLRMPGYRFNLILVSAVWMHVPRQQRDRTFRILVELLAPGGLLVITLRHGPSPDARHFYETDLDELQVMARERSMATLLTKRDEDQFNRTDVWWETFAARLPDDGTESLPLLRHVIVNDRKSSTYKLGLLRTLTRIADGAPGMVLSRTDDEVEIPFGLVGLYWIRLYKPLILHHDLPQLQSGAQCSFSKDSFKALENLSLLDLRIGQTHDDWAETIQEAIYDACETIRDMPANYITHPGTGQHVFHTIDFPTRSKRIREDHFVLNRKFLSRYGSFRVPAALWDCCSRYACWLEPAIVNEWADLMRDYERRNVEDYERGYLDNFIRSALHWKEERRDTALIRGLVDDQIKTGNYIRCVWTNSNLRRCRDYDIDHCFPWSRWSNNDLWNLLPATKKANSNKGNKLPSDSLLMASKNNILKWWEIAYLKRGMEDQFFTEAESSLPMLSKSRNLEDVFEGVRKQRYRLKANQQLAEWYG